jgi:hypothetical protein
MDSYNPFEDIEFRQSTEDSEGTHRWVEKINARPYDENQVAKLIFTTKKESEIASTLSKLADLQSDIEQVLRDKVTNNYMTFIRAKDSIRRTGVELSELNHVVESTHTLIKEVQATRLQDDKLMQSNSSVGDTANRLRTYTEEIMIRFSEGNDNNNNESAADASTANKDVVPKWLRNSPEQLTRFLLERNFSAAVAEVVKVRTYKESSENNIDDAKERANVVRICITVDELGLVVAHILMHSIVELPNSPIWGGAEQRRRLKLLISLGYYDLAAEAFSNASNDIIQAVLNDVEESGDTQTYIMDLSKAFFASLQTVTVNFVTLFADYIDSPGVMSILVSWAHNQVAGLAGIISRQIQVGAKELAALTIIHLKPKPVGVIMSTKRNSVSFAGFDGAKEVNSADTRLLSDIVAINDDDDEVFGRPEDDTLNMVSVPEESAGGGGMLEDEDKFAESLNVALSPGPLTFSRRCLDIALIQSQQYASVALQGLDDLGWFMLPELKRTVTQYAEDLMTETVSQVKGDSWSGVKAPFWEVQFIDQQMPVYGEFSLGRRGEQPEVTTGMSFTWFTLSLSHFLREVWVLLRANYDISGRAEIAEMLQEEEDRGESSDEEGDESKGDYEGWQELCELEPVVVVCLLRLVVVYSLELERLCLHPRGLNPQQIACLRRTMNALAESTIPSLENVLRDTFFDVHFSGLDGASISPTTALKDVRTRLVLLSKE